MRQLLTIFPEHYYSFCTPTQLLYTLEMIDLDTPELVAFIKAADHTFWDHDAISDFVLAVYS